MNMKHVDLLLSPLFATAIITVVISSVTPMLEDYYSGLLAAVSLVLFVISLALTIWRSALKSLGWLYFSLAMAAFLIVGFLIFPAT